MKKWIVRILYMAMVIIALLLAIGSFAVGYYGVGETSTSYLAPKGYFTFGLLAGWCLFIVFSAAITFISYIVPKIRGKKSPENEQVTTLVEGLADIASNLGSGSVYPSEADNASRPLRVKASESLHAAGYEYYECCGKDNVDGWFTKKELAELK